MKIRSLLALSCFTFPFVPAVSAGTDPFGEIAFVGDSITQGAGENLNSRDKSRSYRYHLWKIFLSNGVEWNPVGSQTIFRDGSVASATQTPGFRGRTYVNRSEGHYGWTGAGFLGGQSGAQPNSGTGTLSAWLADSGSYPSGKADTVTLLLGINDLNAAGATYESVAANARKIVAAYQKANPKVAVHVFSVLPRTGTARNGQAWRERVAEYDAYLKKQIDSGTWSTATSRVVFHDITAGIDPNGFPDGLHPGNGAGALAVAKNIAVALGLNPTIDFGTRLSAAGGPASQVSFEKNADGSWTASVPTAAGTPRPLTYFTDAKGAGAKWTVEGGRLKISSDDGGSGIKLENRSGNAGAHEFAAELSVKLDGAFVPAKTKSHFLGVWCGNGESVGQLYVGPHGIYWGGTDDGNLLCGYVSDDYANGFSTTENFRKIRVAYLFDEGESTRGRFYVWVDGELVGDGLKGNASANVAAWRDTLLVGDIGSAYEVRAEIASLSFDAGTPTVSDSSEKSR